VERTASDGACDDSTPRASLSLRFSGVVFCQVKLHPIVAAFKNCLGGSAGRSEPRRLLACPLGNRQCTNRSKCQ
jgi:hypothetical protein